MKIDINRLGNYLSDLDPDTSIVDEAIATIEAVAENKTDDELYERERPLMIAYLALRIVKAGLNVSPQKQEIHAADVAPVVHGHWSKEMRFTEDFMGNRTYGYKCSICGKLANRLQFCGNCGAKMDSKANPNCDAKNERR